MREHTLQEWIARVDQERRAGHLGLLDQALLETLASFGGAQGICPSRQAIVDRLGSGCLRSVASALTKAADLQLLSIERRYRREGWRWVRTSSRYLLTLPDQPVQPRNRVHASKGKIGSGITKQEESEDAIQAPTVVASAAPQPDVSRVDLLKARRDAFAERVLRGGHRAIEAMQHAASTVWGLPQRPHAPTVWDLRAEYPGLVVAIENDPLQPHRSRALLRLPYRADITARLKALRGAFFVAASKCWSVPQYAAGGLREILWTASQMAPMRR